MERKKKREKPSANGINGDGTSSQSGDAYGWQREDQAGTAKRVSSSGNIDSPTLHGTTAAFNWSLAQHLSLSQQQQYTYAPSPQLSQGQAVASQQQAHAFQVPPQGGPHGLGGSQNQDAFSQNQNVAHPSFQTGVTESSWSHPAGAAGAQSLVGRAPAFPFPPPPYSVAWWGHNPYQPAFPYMYPGHGSYPCPMPAAPPIGAIQRGIIKPPAGLSQKHIRIWEAQSMENMQLWTTTTQLWAAVARSDAEIALQRTKILKLEAELLSMKSLREGNTQSDPATAHQPVSKRGRRKKAIPAPIETMAVSEPVSDCNASSEPGSRARSVSYTDNTPTRTEAEVKDKSVLSIPEVGFRPSTKDCNQKSSTLTVNLPRTEISSQKHSVRQTPQFRNLTNNSLTVGKDDIAFGRINHLNSPFKPNTHMGGRTDGHSEQNLKENVVSFAKTPSSLDHQNIMPGVMSYSAINSGSLYSESNTNLMPNEAIARTQLQAHFIACSMEKSVPHEKSWQYAGEDGSDEQDEGGVSMQDDDDGDDVDDDDDENTLDDIHNEKVRNLWQSSFQ